MTTTGSASCVALLAALLLAPPAAAQTTERDTMPGYPIRDATVVSSCVACHAQDSTGRMTRISYMRKTPEGWESSIRRMVTLNGAQLEPAAARAVLRYLADEQGLAPEEARPGRFEVERRMIDWSYAGDDRTEQTCRACHSLGRVITQRRTKDEWGLLVAMHRGYYPIVDFQGFRRGGPASRDTANAGHPMDHAINHLARAFPLRTADWSAWSATMRPPRLEGDWALSGFEPRRGPFFGRITIARVPGSESEFTTEASYVYARTGTAVRRAGRATVYTGFQWRGRSSEAGRDEPWREVVFVEPGWRSMAGRWFRGDYDEFGMDVALTRLGSDAVLTGAQPRAVRRGTSQELRLYGANLPRSLAPAAIDLGPGLRVERVVQASPGSITLAVRADTAAQVGARDVFAAGATLRAAIVVYDSISRIRVTPQAGMARVGGANFPKQFQSFDVTAWNDGPDGKPDTPDDLELGAVDVTWSLEEYGVTYDDDDLAFVGRLDASGLFTPGEDGPNPQRSGERNNVGDVWVVATHVPAGRESRPLQARAHLLVTVPLYMRWEPWRIER